MAMARYSRLLSRPRQCSVYGSRAIHSGLPTRASDVGFVGLGKMGYGMARNLGAAMTSGDRLVVHDINQDAVTQLAAEAFPAGVAVEVASSPREVAEKSDALITVLREPCHVCSVYATILAAPGLPPRRHPRLFVDASTIDLETSASMAALAARNSQGVFVDAPMSGGTVGAATGTLTFMVGCDVPAFARVAELLTPMAKRVVRVGPPGAGLKGKLANNYLLGVINVAAAETMAMGVRWGLDPHLLAGLLGAATGRCWPIDTNNPVPGVVPSAPASRGYAGGFDVALQKKDLCIALRDAERHGVRLVLGQPTLDVYNEAISDERCRGCDISVVYRLLGGKE